MKLEEFLEKYRGRTGYIIKRKKEILDFTVDAGLITTYNLRIYADAEKLCIGNKIIKMCDLERISVFKNKRYSRIKTCGVKFIEKNQINYKSIIVTSFSEEDLDKIGQLIEYFLYSRDFESFDMCSDDYEFLLEDYSQVSNLTLNTYTEDQKNVSEIHLNNTVYHHIQVLPKEYYKKYSSKDYLLFETKFNNSNYMDVWISECKQKRDSIIANIFLFLLLAILILFGIGSMVFEIIDAFK